MGELTVRPAREGEWAEVGRLTLEAYLAGGHIDVGERYAAKLADAAPRAREAELLVAVDAAGALVGTVTIAPPGSSWTEVARDGELEFRMLAVHSDARGRGVGETLVRRVLGRAVELGVSGVVLSSREDMRAAHRLYERLGFARVPDRDWWPVPGLRVVTYRLDLAVDGAGE